MLVVYFTPDDVNEELAMQFAAACGLTVRCIPFGSSRRNGEFEAVVYDWDYLPLPWRPDILATLLWNPLPCPVALHGYHLAEEEIEALRANGVQVHHCLQPNVFRGLCPASKPNRTSDVAGGSDQLQPAGGADANKRGSGHRNAEAPFHLDYRASPKKRWRAGEGDQTPMEPSPVSPTGDCRRVSC